MLNKGLPKILNSQNGKSRRVTNMPMFGSGLRTVPGRIQSSGRIVKGKSVGFMCCAHLCAGADNTLNMYTSWIERLPSGTQWPDDLH